ncbi:MAG TPA: hypothetical protein VHL54_05675, partial [Actinomycetota bacterium]|nr:hypothetical protein [Actinomycetota bacterium]
VVPRRIDADGVHYLIDSKLAPLGITAGTTAAPPRPPALSLAGRTVLFSARAVRPAATRLRHLFRPPVVALVLAAVLAANLSLLATADFRSPVSDLVQQPVGVLALGAIVLLSAVFHEFGHAAGGAYGGARPGAIGAGIFVVWPAFFSDITDSYRLSRAARIRTDLGGIYFNLLLTLPLAGLHALTGNPLWKWGVVAQFLIIVQQLLPFLRLDGYYLVSDLTGVPDLFGHLQPALRNLLPGRAVDPSFAGLRSGVRRAVTVWAVGTSLFVGWFGCVMALELPQFAAGAGSLLVSLGSSTISDFAGRRYLFAGAGLVQLLLVAIQVAGIAVVLRRLVRRGIRSPIRRGARRPI